ncbi:MAG: glycosyltransferase family 4 protein, partial [Lachnospiraceae bacterium]|nr:glycosyltransferase family 4 protein [Lachnospiraceae bacterium]
RVLWVLNIMPPVIAQALNREYSVKEGWISGILQSICSGGEDVEPGLCFPVGKEEAELSTTVQVGKRKLPCYGFYEPTERPEVYEEYDLIQRLKEIIRSFEPDILHIFGTEYGHCLAAVKAYARPVRTLIGIQGVISACAKEYMADLPREVQRQSTLRDWLKQDSIRQQQEKFAIRGEREKIAVACCGHVTGRTEFDRQQVLAMNPKALYHPMNETLREVFYEGHWEWEKCRRHSIFVSQADYPLKGFHYLLQAANRLVHEFPDLRITVAGNSLVKYESLKDKLKISGYGRYLRRLLRETGMEGRVEFTGKLSAEEMKEQYLKCHTYVCASALENSPNSVGEAMLLGVPVVASRTGGIPDMVTHGKEGLLFPKGNIRALTEAIADVWESEELCTRLSRSAVERARMTHDGETNFGRLMEIYEEMMKSGSREDRVP